MSLVSPQLYRLDWFFTLCFTLESTKQYNMNCGATIYFTLPVLMIFTTTANSGEQFEVASLEKRILNSTQGGEKILSRRKRFLVFPEGSSLQLVFCLTDASVSVIGDIIFWGSTAALAWELPQDPYSPFDHHADPLHRRQDTAKNLYYTDEKGRLLFKVPYKRKPIVNPAFAKRSVDKAEPRDKARTSPDVEPEAESDVDRKWMHERQGKREYLQTKGMDKRHVDFHRVSRASLYEKLEVLFKSLGMNGRECVLRTLCEVARSDGVGQGTFLEELARAVFTLPEGKAFEKQHLLEYDVAGTPGQSCELIYPDCDYGSEPMEL